MRNPTLYIVYCKRMTSKKYREDSWRYENVQEKDVGVKMYCIQFLM